MRGLLWQASAWRRAFVWAFLAGVGLTFAVLVAVTAYGVFEVRAAGDGARYPVVETAASGTGSTSFDVAGDDVPGQGQFTVVTLYPDGPAAPLPPGIPSDVEPGDVFLSPSLKSLDPSLRMDERYGPVDGTITAEGLSAPDENLAYIIGGGHPPSGSQRAVDFGESVSPWAVGSSSAFFGESMTIQPLGAVLPAVGVLVVLPAVGLGVSCAGQVSGSRRRRDGVLEALGARPRVRWGVEVRSTLPGLVCGSVGAAFAAWVYIRSQPTVPYVDFVVSPDALPISRAALAALAAVIVGLVCFTVPYRRSRAHARPTPAPLHLSPAWTLAGPVVVALASWLPDRVAEPPSPVNVVLRWALAIVSLVAVAVSVSAALIALGGWLRRLGHRHGHATALVTGGSLAGTGRNFVVMTLAVGSMCLAAFFTAQYAALGQSFSVDGRSLHRTIGTSAAVVEMPDRAAAGRFLKTVPAELGVVSVRGAALTGDCASLEHMGFSCDSAGRQSRATAVLRALHMPSATEVRSSRPLPQAGRYLVVDTTGAPVDVPELKALANEASGQVTQVGEVASQWITATDGLIHQLRWVPVWAAAGLTLGLIGVIISSLGGQAEQSRRMAPVLALFGSDRARTAIVVGLTTGVPLLTAGVASIYAHMAQSASFLARIDMPGAFTPLALTLTGLVLLGAATMSVIATGKTLSDAEKWTPGGR